MKKLIIAGLVAAAMTSFAKTTIMVGTNEVDAVEYCTNFVTNHTKNAGIFAQKTWQDVDASVIAACDDILDKGGICAKWTKKFNCQKFPKCTLNFIEQIMTTEYPQDVDFANIIFAKYAEGQKVELLDRIHGKCFDIAYDIKTKHCINNKVRNEIIKNAEKLAKMQIRKEGKSFVDKDGVSPIKVRVDAVTAAFNAPKLAGLQAAFAGIGIDFGYTFQEGLLSDEELTTLKNKILYGEVEFSGVNQQILSVHLGVEEYNKFVKVYNEGN